MRRKKTHIKYRKERAILSDVLPYELPLTFSNRHFYDFLLRNKMEIRDGRISWKKDDAALDATVRLLFGMDKNIQIETKTVTKLGKIVEENSFKIPDKFESIPFGFKLRHKDDEFRELTICHPRHQLQLIDFYDSYKELILYHCSVSPFSIRRPSRISKFVFHKDSTHSDTLSGEAVGVEEFNKEYENLRSFFVYKDYSYIFKFYESYRFHRCEKKYNKLLKLDISKCFDSIYTHSLTWALYGRESVKENVNPSKKTFGGKFDKLMQQMNYNETNGIIIGPEFSRIFAEMILQSIDRVLRNELQCDKFGHIHKSHYEIFRYVDDYFIFYNDETVKNDIVQVLQLKLKDFKLYLNKAKAVSYDKPIITNISMAKLRIERLLDEKLAYRIENIERTGTAGTKILEKIGFIKINSNLLITQFKTIVKEHSVDYKDTLNYALSIVEGKSGQIIKDHRSTKRDQNSEKQLGEAIEEICEFTFFIYSVSPRAHTTIRLCRILYLLTSFLNEKGIQPDIKHSAFKVIFDNISLILVKNRHSEHTPAETLYLLIALAELGKNYWLSMETLCSYLKIQFQKTIGTVQIQSSPNYITLVVLLFYMKNRREYDQLRTDIERIIRKRFEQKKATLRKDTELTLLLMDILACPYVTQVLKDDLLKIYDVTGKSLRTAIINKRKYWFTKWTTFDFGKELDAKQSREVY
jgi:hypothetical protein